MKAHLNRNGRHGIFRTLALFLFVISPFSVAAEDAQLFYVSSSMGNDSNPGTIERPKRTIRSITKDLQDHLEIRLRRGDVFFENIQRLSHTTIDAYGEGELPVLCGFKILKVPSAWTSFGEDVWRLDLSKSDDFDGFPNELATYKERLNDIGCIYDIKHGRIIGHLVSSIELLNHEGDIFTTDRYRAEEVDDETFRHVYLKTKINPCEMGRVAFSVCENGVFLMEHCTIKNIAVMGFAKHGMCNLKDCTIEGCALDIIGGAIQIGYKNWVRYGNGIELYETSYNDRVENCIFSRTYDCGVTIQAIGKIRNSPKNIHFVNNRFYHCRQAFEHFMNPSDSVFNPQYVNCEFAGNICYEMGENEFSTPQKRDANILNHEKSSRGLKIEDNVFYGAPHHCGYVFADGMKNNKVYIWEGQYLNHYHALGSYPTIYANSSLDIEDYKKRTGDKSDIIILKKGSLKDRRIAKILWKKVGWKVWQFQN